jgi:hypothetical protein
VLWEENSEGEYGKIFEKNKSPSDWLKSIQVNSAFYADSEYDNSFNIGSVFYSPKVLTKNVYDLPQIVVP